MAKGYDVNKKRQEQLDSLGRELTRRAGSKCELCDASGVSLSVMEIPPADEDVNSESCIFICEECRDQIVNPKRFTGERWRCLGDKVWSETAVVKIMAVRILNKVAADERWAADILDEIYLDEDEQQTVDEYAL